MRFLFVLLATVFVVCSPARAQSPVEGVQALKAALIGNWTGVLEYRDYSEPSTSTKRVKLPTWLSVTLSESCLRFRYTYDDGPQKTVVSTSLVALDAAHSLWTSTPEDKKEKPSSDAIEGLEKLKNGRGALLLTGSGNENGQPVEVRTTVRIGRNLMEMLKESRQPGGEFAFRDSYTMVRAQPPASK